MLRKAEKRRILSGVFCICTFLLLFLGSVPGRAQESLPQVRANGKTLPLAWTGGLNACHFAAIDLDGDGKNDYIAFDRIGSRIRCFSSEWQLMPGLEQQLPPLRYWVQAHDYDGDGRQDLFTFNGISGISLYKNVSEKTPNGYELRFELVTQGLPAEMFGTASPLYCTWADYPAIADIDGDGDLDVLNFWVPSTGDFLLYYRNYAAEELNRTDTFLLRTEDWSWGCFVENEESNAIILDSCSSRQTQGTPSKGRGKARPGAAKHAGSTMFAIQNPENGLFDIVLGDVGYPGLLFLHNGGSPQQAHIISYDTVFPLSEPCSLYNFPLLSQVMWNDSLCYLISPFETDPFNAQGAQSLWLYADTGGGAAHGKLLQKDFLQDRMLDFGTGATPVAYDYNRDGKADLVVGNYGQLSDAYYQGGSWITQKTASLALLENTGTDGQPAFELKTTDYLGLSRYGLRALHPAFADLDGDGRDEMVLGMEDGRLWLFRLHGNGEEAELLDSLFLGAELSGFSAPALFDLNQDGLLDLIVGEKQRSWKTAGKRITKGSLSYYQNTGAKKNTLPEFTLITDSLGGVDVIDREFSNFGYSRPSFFKDRQGEILLACGSENGEVFLYDRISGNPNGTFRLAGKASANGHRLNVGIHAAPLLHDWNGDGLPELITGNQCGGLQYIDGTEWQAMQDVGNEAQTAVQSESIRLFPNPAQDGFHARITQQGSYLLLDIHTRILKRFSWTEGLHYVDMSRLPAGIYLLKAENRPQASKIIKR
ncbi:MAG: T9SS type A sorting domain-containing protein [Bacteroides sp.]|nr:T9SS type A sorting domain-containing protein [Bacteroides sp.]MCM1086460.1 T9SS type A sorting domain-containing protein [Bacteroides sp.]